MRPSRITLLGFFGLASATLRMPGFFGDDMVIQTRSEYGTRAFLNGFAAPNETVTISGGYTVTADAGGEWAVMLNPVSAGKSIDLTVTGEDGTSFTAKRVLYGDVFLCAGGDGMAAPLSADANATQEIASVAALQHFRLLSLPAVAADSPRPDIAAPATWLTPTSASAASFSAACALTARELMAARGTRSWPVGLVLAAKAGSTIDEWVPPATAAACAATAAASSGLWNGTIAPLFKLSMRATLFAQGEADATRGTPSERYGCLFNGLIKAWRDNGPIGDFGFSFAQLGAPRQQANSSDDAWAAVRVGQAMALPRPGGASDVTAMGAALDLDPSAGAGAIGKRLALATLHTTYAKQPAPFGAPSFSSGPKLINITHGAAGSALLKFAPGTAHGVTLRATGGGSCSDSPFELLRSASGSAAWVPAPVLALRDGSVELDVKGGDAAARVRYAWRATPRCVLVNANGLPMATFDEPLAAAPPRDAGVVRLRAGGPPHAPPLGSNSWNYYHCNIDENTVKAIADEYVRNGMKDAGYTYVNIDDCWQVQRRNDGTIVEDPARFPSGMKALADYVHSRGLKFGLYTARGTGTCQSRPGSRDHELIDAKTYCDWGIDYIKIDGCQGTGDANTSWTRFHQGLADCYQRTGRYIVQSVESCSSPDTCGRWIGGVANLWRTGGDVQARWSSILGNIHRNNGMARVANATLSNFNDPDMLQVSEAWRFVGNVGMTHTEQLSHFMMWCIASAPLLAGNDLVHASKQTLAILTAPELIAVDQDPGIDGRLQGVSLGPAATAVPSSARANAGVMKVVVQACDSESTSQLWGVENRSAITQRESGLLLTVAGCARAPLDPFGPGANVTAAPATGTGSKCAGADQRFTLHPNGTITTAVDGQCLNVYGGIPGKPYNHLDVQTFSCAKGSTEKNSQWDVRADGRIASRMPHTGCLATKAWTPGPAPSPPPSQSELWAKGMSDGSVVALLVNLDGDTTQDLTASWAQLGMAPGTKVTVRDLWLRENLGTVADAFTAKAVPPHGARMVKLTKVSGISS
eukprot:g2502.t1